MDASAVSIIVSALALAISTVTAWFTLWRRGKVRMTQPAIVFFGPDGSRGPLKIFLRALIYSTADRGHIIEHLFVRLVRGTVGQTFPTWILRDGTLSRGSGMFVDRRGVTSDHHFLLARDGTAFEFTAGEYVIEVYATGAGWAAPRLLTRQSLHLAADDAEAIKTVDSGVFFDWNPDLGRYNTHIDHNRTAELNRLLEQAVKLPQGRKTSRE